MNDSEKLRTLADWFDMEEKSGRWPSRSQEVQKDLRRIATILGEGNEENDRLKKMLKKREKKIVHLKKKMIVLEGYDFCDACGKPIYGDNIGIECNLHKDCSE